MSFKPQLPALPDSAAGLVTAAVLAVVSLAVMGRAHAGPAPEKIFHFGGIYIAESPHGDPNLVAPAGYNPVPFLWPNDPMINAAPSARARLTYRWQQSGATATPQRAWRAFLVTQHAAPVIGGNAASAHDVANTLAWFQREGQPIDFVFADLEGYYPEGDWSNVNAVINEVRGTAVGAHAAIGNFDWYPGQVDLSADYPWFADRRAVNRYYGTRASNGQAGLTVAMPVAYAMQSYELHSDDSASWGASWWQKSSLPVSLIASLTSNQQAAVGFPYLSPNERAGMFYGPLEQVSLAKRNLPPGHQLIPWVSAFQAQKDVPRLEPGMVPTLQDNEAMLEHLRLRGADGYYSFGLEGTRDNQGTYSDGSPFAVPPSRQYAAFMESTWDAMDWFFALPTRVGDIVGDHPLNLYTFKNTGGTYRDPAGRNGGIEWSGYQRGNRVLAVISNLGNGVQAAAGLGVGASGNWGSVMARIGSHLPTQSPLIPAGNHLVVQFLTNPSMLSFARYPLGSTLGSKQGWHSSGTPLRVAPAVGAGVDGAVLTITGAGATAWVANAQTANSGGIGATANDAMVYTCKLHIGWLGDGTASFGPVVGEGSMVPVSTMRQGPTVAAFVGGSASRWVVGTHIAPGRAYTAINARPAANTWYLVAMVINPVKNLVSIYVRNLTKAGGWTLLDFRSDGQTMKALPAGLVPSKQSPSLYNGFQISGSPGAQFDALGAVLYPYPGSPASTYDAGIYLFISQ